jgi:hypothetical protein
MIHDLKRVLQLKAFGAKPEFVVSEGVFLEILRKRGAQAPLVLNGAYDSSRFRYINKVSWDGTFFICITNKLLNAGDDNRCGKATRSGSLWAGTHFLSEHPS